MWLKLSLAKGSNNSVRYCFTGNATWSLLGIFRANPAGFTIIWNISKWTCLLKRTGNNVAISSPWIIAKCFAHLRGRFMTLKIDLYGFESHDAPSYTINLETHKYRTKWKEIPSTILIKFNSSDTKWIDGRLNDRLRFHLTTLITLLLHPGCIVNLQNLLKVLRWGILVILSTIKSTLII